MSLQDTLDRAQEDYGGNSNSNFFRFEKSGTYRIRVLSDPIALATHFFDGGSKPQICYGQPKGCPFHEDIVKDGITTEAKAPSVKFVSYVLDRNDGKIKIGEMPYSVVRELLKYQKDDELTFENFPMTYDIKITVDKENKDPKQIYSVIPGQARTPLTAEQETELSNSNIKNPIANYVEARNSKQMEDHKQRGIWITEEQRAAHFEALKKMGEDRDAANGVAPLESLPSIDYGEANINVDDIPF